MMDICSKALPVIMLNRPNTPVLAVPAWISSFTAATFTPGAGTTLTRRYRSSIRKV